MHEFAEAARERVLRYDGERWEVRPPVVREAIEVLAALEKMRGGEDKWSHYLMLTILPRWFPSEFLTVFDRLSDGKQVECLSHLLYTGVVRKKSKRKSRGQPPGWDDLLGTYALAYNADPWQVYNEVPFPFFLNMVQRADRQLARHTLARLELMDLPHMAKGRRAVLKRIQYRAGYYDPTQGAPRKEIERDRAALRSMFGVGS